MSNGQDRMERLKEILEIGEDKISYTQAVMHFVDVGIGIYDELEGLRDMNTRQFRHTKDRLEDIEGRVDDTESRLDKTEARVTLGVGLTALVALISAILIVTGIA